MGATGCVWMVSALDLFVCDDPSATVRVIFKPTFEYPPHPLAAMFPMIEGKEKEELQASVRLNGFQGAF
jgi:hypothetical protein